QDILCKEGWWENPGAVNAGAVGNALHGVPPDTEWTFHPAALGEDCAQMYAFDIDGDGDNDVLSTAAHKVGMWWHEQLADGKFQTHLIDDSFTQTHALCVADMNGDGQPDFVTGKRWW